MGDRTYLRGERASDVIGGGEVLRHVSVPLHERKASPRSHILAIQVRVFRRISTAAGVG